MALAELESQLLSAEEIERIAAQDWAPEELLDALGDSRAVVRANATRLVGLRARDAEPAALEFAIDALKALVKDPSSDVRQATLEALSGSRHPLAASLLASRLTDAVESIRDSAQRHLETIGGGDIPALLSALGDDPLEEPLIEALTKVLLGIGPKTMPALQDALVSSESPDIRCLAAGTLGRFGKLAAPTMGALVSALRDKDGSVRKAVITSLDKIARGQDPETPPKPTEDFAVPQFFTEHLGVDALADDAEDLGELLLLSMTDSESLFGRANAARALACLAEPGRGAVEKLGVMLFDREESVREAAIAAITHLGDRSATAAPWLISSLSGAYRETLRERAIDLIDQHLDLVGDAFIEGLRTDTARLRDALRPLLDQLKERAMPLLARGLKHPSVLIRLNSVMAMRLLRDFCIGDAFEALKATSLKEGNTDVRLAARATVLMIEENRQEPEEDKEIYESPTDKVIGALEDMTDDPDPEVRQMAQQVMRQLHRDRPEAPPPAIDGFDEIVLSLQTLAEHTDELTHIHMCALIESKRSFIRANAALSLGVLPYDGDCVDKIELLLTDNDDDVRRAASRALRHLGEEAIVRARVGLLKRLGDSDSAVNETAREALLSLKEQGLKILATDGLQISSAHDVVLPLLLEQGPTIVPVLTETLSHLSVGARSLAALGLFRLGGKLAAPAREALLAAIRKEPRLKEVGMRAVRAIDKALAPPILLEPKPLPFSGFDAEVLGDDALSDQHASLQRELIEPLLGDGRAIVRANAARALGLLGETSPKFSLLLKDSSDAVRSAVVSALAAVGQAAAPAVPQLIESLLDPNEAIAADVRAALVTFNGEPKDVWISVLRTNNDHLLSLVQEILCEIGPAGITVLEGALEHPSGVIRGNALEALGVFVKQADAARALLEGCKEDNDTDIRTRARNAIAQLDELLKPPPTPPESIEIPGFEEGALSIDALTPHASSCSEAALLLALKDGRAHGRENAVQTLGILAPNSMATAAALCITLKDASDAVRQAAPAAIAKQDAQLSISLPAMLNALAAAQEPLAEALLDALVSFDIKDLVKEAVTLMQRVNATHTQALTRLTLKIGDAFDAALEGAYASKELSDLQYAQIASLRTAFARAAAQDEQTSLFAEPLVIPIDGFDVSVMLPSALKKKISGVDGDLLIRALDDGRAIVRTNAVRALGLLGYKSDAVVTRIALALKDGNEETRESAAGALKTLNHAPEIALPALARALPKAAPSFQAELAAAIGSFASGGLDPFKLLLEEDDWTDILSNLDEVLLDHSKAFIDLLRGVIDDEEQSSRAQRSAQDTLTRMENLRRAAMSPPVTLEARVMPFDGFDAELLSEEALSAHSSAFDEASLLLLLGDGRATVRANAASALGSISGASDATAIKLSFALKDGSDDVQVAVIRSLGNLGLAPEQVVPRLAASLPKADDDRQSILMEALDGFETTFFPSLLQLLDDNHWFDVLRVLCSFFEEEEIKAFTATLEAAAKDDARTSRAQSTARKSLKVLAESQKPPLFIEPPPMPTEDFADTTLDEKVLKKQAKSFDPALLQALLQDGRDIVRENATRALGFVGAERGAASVPHLTLRLKDVQPDIRVAAVKSLANLKASPDVAVPALTNALKDASNGLAEIVISTLKSFGADVIPPLEARIKKRWLKPDEELTQIVRALPQTFIKSLTAMISEGNTPFSRENALELLLAIGAPASGSSKAVIACLSEKKGLIRVKALRFLIETQESLDAKTISTIEGLLEKDLRHSLRHAALDALEKFKAEG